MLLSKQSFKHTVVSASFRFHQLILFGSKQYLKELKFRSASKASRSEHDIEWIVEKFWHCIELPRQEVSFIISLFENWEAWEHMQAEGKWDHYWDLIEGILVSRLVSLFLYEIGKRDSTRKSIPSCHEEDVSRLSKKWRLSIKGSLFLWHESK